jgi:hypothetical protein
MPIKWQRWEADRTNNWLKLSQPGQISAKCEGHWPSPLLHRETTEVKPLLRLDLTDPKTAVSARLSAFAP